MKWHTEIRKISELKEWENNPRTISDKAYQRLKEAIEKRGFHDIIKIDENNVVLSGNQRLKILKELGYEEVECKVPDEKLTQKQKEQVALESNIQDGEWDMDKLAEEFGDVMEEIGFGDLLPDIAEEVEEDDYEEPEDLETTVVLGDIYQLGEHRLMCGDSTKIEDVEKLMNGEKADMVFTDPPYGMDLDTDYSKMGNSGIKRKRVIGDDKQFDASFLLGTFDYCKEIFLWGADYYVETLGRVYPDLGSWIIWDKYSDNDTIGLLDGRFGSAFETCWSKTPHKREIVRVLVTTNYTARGDEKRVHPTQKPVALGRWFFDRWGNNGDIVVDLFGGSGSTLIACEQTNRKCYMMEIDPHYCQVIIDRWEKYTGEKAVKLT